MLTRTQALHMLTLGIVYRPVRALATLTSVQHHWRLPLLFSVILCGVTTAGMLPSMIPIGTDALATLPSAFSDNTLLVSFVMWFLGTVMILLITVANWLSQGFLLGQVSRLGHQAISLRTALALLPLLWLPMLLRIVVHAGYVFAGGSVEHNGLAFFITDYRQLDVLGQFVRNILWQIDLFLVWHLILAGIVFHRFAHVPASRLVDALLLYGFLTVCVQAWMTSWMMSL